jgi:tetratricopeptide (TPR) repeat protein
VWCIVLLLSATPPAADTAQAWLDAGLESYRQGAFEEALEQLEQGLAREPLPEILYALGQTERRLGHCKKAIEYYGAFLLRARTKVQAKAAEVQIERCRAEAAEPAKDEKPVAVAPEPALPPAPVLEPVVAPEPAAVSAWYRDAWGALAGASGVGLGVVGALFAAMAQQAIASSSESYGQYLAAREAVPRRTIGLALAGAGGALIVTAVIRYVWLARAE